MIEILNHLSITITVNWLIRYAVMLWNDKTSISLREISYWIIVHTMKHIYLHVHVLYVKEVYIWLSYIPWHTCLHTGWFWWTLKPSTCNFVSAMLQSWPMIYDMRVIDVRVTEMSCRTKTIYVKVHISQDFLNFSFLFICPYVSTF